MRERAQMAAGARRQQLPWDRLRSDAEAFRHLTIPASGAGPATRRAAYAVREPQACGSRATCAAVRVRLMRRHERVGMILVVCIYALICGGAAGVFPHRWTVAPPTGGRCQLPLRRTLELRGGGPPATSADALTVLDHGLFESESEVSVELGEVIGFGSFSTVYAGETAAGDSVAVKRVALKNTDDINRMRLQREIHILSSLEHPHVVRLRRVIQDEGFVSLVLDRCMGGELFDFVNDFQTFHANGERSWRRTNTTDMQTVTELHIAKMVRQVLMAVDYMHSHDVVHRDLKLENVMLTQPFTSDTEPDIKVVDLGFSRQVSGEEMFTACGSTLYIAPEVLASKSTKRGYGKECDLWAVGVMTYILLCCRPPFAGANSYEVGQAIRKGHFTYPDYALVSDEARELIGGLLTVDPKERLTAAEALDHPWIAQAQTAPKEETLVAAIKREGAEEVRRLEGATSFGTWLRNILITVAGVGTLVSSRDSAAQAEAEPASPPVQVPPSPAAPNSFQLPMQRIAQTVSAFAIARV